jgi:hypothetical protein
MNNSTSPYRSANESISPRSIDNVTTKTNNNTHYNQQRLSLSKSRGFFLSVIWIGMVLVGWNLGATSRFITTTSIKKNMVDNSLWSPVSTGRLEAPAEYINSSSSISSFNLSGAERARQDNVPAWMNDYFSWHALNRKQILTPDDFYNFKYLVIRCLEQDKKCGGTADRLHGIPLYLLLAWQSNRMLLIQWDRPTRLEEFLVPPPGGLDWTTPESLRDLLNTTNFHFGVRTTDIIEYLFQKRKGDRVIGLRHQR